VVRVLVLAGTTEATSVAGALSRAGHDVISSLAGVTRAPVPRSGAVRQGGFGGAEGLARYLTDNGVGALVDATHPFAATMPFHAADAAAATGVPSCRLLRPGWRAGEADRWHPVASVPEAPPALAAMGAERVFLAVGRQSLGPFASSRDVWFLVRAIEPIGAELPGAEVVLARGPFHLEQELALLQAHRIDTIVTKNSGGTATEAKLVAARQLQLQVVMVARPPQPDVETVETVAAGVAWCQALAPSLSTERGV
jgi:precorrin-6A/cobalt-precorrin-6A reductase